MAALSVQARGCRGPGLHIGLLSVRVNILGPALNKCHSQWGRNRPSPPARLHADNPSQKPCWSAPAVACGSGAGKVGGGEVLFWQWYRLQHNSHRFFDHIHINVDTSEKAINVSKIFCPHRHFCVIF